MTTEISPVIPVYFSQVKGCVPQKRTMPHRTARTECISTPRSVCGTTRWEPANPNAPAGKYRQPGGNTGRYGNRSATIRPHSTRFRHRIATRSHAPHLIRVAPGRWRHKKGAGYSQPQHSEPTSHGRTPRENARGTRTRSTGVLPSRFPAPPATPGAAPLDPDPGANRIGRPRTWPGPESPDRQPHQGRRPSAPQKPREPLRPARSENQG